jgi:glycogen(starch) synthase
MRICVVTREYPPVTLYTGGIGTHYSAMAPEMARQGHDVHVLTLAEERPRSFERDGVVIHVRQEPPPRGIYRFRDLVWSAAVSYWLRALGSFDAIFAPEWGGEAAFYSRCRSQGPLITNLATSLDQVRLITPTETSWREPAHVHDALQRRLERRQTERSDGIAACSSAVLHWARELWDLDGIRSEVLPNFVQPDDVRARAKGGLPEGFPQERPVVLYFGRLEPRKGVDVLAESMRDVWRSSPDAQLVYIGADVELPDGEKMSDRIRAIVGRSGNRVHFLGPQPPDRLFPSVAAADVVAFPSRWENFSIAALEALALGKPIVATADTGFVDFVEPGRTGLLVAPESVEDLSDAIVRLVTDSELRAQLEAGARKSSETYRAENMVPRYIDFFDEVRRAAA